MPRVRSNTERTGSPRLREHAGHRVRFTITAAPAACQDRGNFLVATHLIDLAIGARITVPAPLAARRATMSRGQRTAYTRTRSWCRSEVLDHQVRDNRSFLLGDDSTRSASSPRCAPTSARPPLCAGACAGCGARSDLRPSEMCASGGLLQLDTTRYNAWGATNPDMCCHNRTHESLHVHRSAHGTRSCQFKLDAPGDHGHKGRLYPGGRLSPVVNLLPEVDCTQEINASSAASASSIACAEIDRTDGD